MFYQSKYRKGIHLTDHDEVLKIEAVMYAKSVDVLMLSYYNYNYYYYNLNLIILL